MAGANREGVGSNGDHASLIFRVVVADTADHKEVVAWFRNYVLPAYFTAPVGVQLEIRASDRPDD